MSVGFTGTDKKHEVVPGKLVIGSADPKELAEQLKKVAEEVKGSGSLENELAASQVHELTQDVGKAKDGKGVDFALTKNRVKLLKPTEKDKEELGFGIATPPPKVATPNPE